MKRSCTLLLVVLAVLAACEKTPLSPPPETDPIPKDTLGPGPVDPGQPPPGQDATQRYAAFQLPEAQENWGALAFPGAEGGGMYTTGGRGGKVIHVTNLQDSGTGSLREAINQSGPRTIVFDVAGVIELASTLTIRNGDLTIAGQTAPGQGICLKNYSTQINASNVIIRFLRFRMGDEKKVEGDAIWGRYNQNIIIDHCSMSWSTDECASFYANRHFTLQWCLLTESLKKSVHGKGDHGYGGIWGGRDASFHHNLLSAHDSRNPRLDHPEVYGNYVESHRGAVDLRNNVIYNWGSNHAYGGEAGSFNLVDNYYKPGPASKDRAYFLDVYALYTKDGKTYADAYPQLYLKGNVHTAHQDLGAHNAKGLYWHHGTSYAHYGSTRSVPWALTGPQNQKIYTTTHSAAEAFPLVCDLAGASLVRDAVDRRACDDARQGKASISNGGNGSTGGIIDTQSAAGGWPAYSATAEEGAKIKDSDGDGMPDSFETEMGLDKSSAKDGGEKTLDLKGRYTNLEMYLHYLVRDVVRGQNAGGTATALD